MKLIGLTSTSLQFIAIVAMSVAASYGFEHTQTTLQVGGLCFYRYLTYVVAIFLGYVCFSSLRKHIALTFSIALSALALSPVGFEVIELFPLVAPLLAVLMGITSVLVSPRSRGRGFFEFLLVLILPAIIAESRVGGSVQLLATVESVNYYELIAITVTVIGGYFFLRYATLANLSRLELLSSGASRSDVAEANKTSNILTILVVACACGIAAFLMAVAPIVASAFQAEASTLPLYVLGLALATGIAITTAFYIFQLSYRQTTGSLHAD